MSRYGKGARRSPHDARDWPLHRIGATSVRVPDAVNRDNLVKLVTDQSITSSCVGQACARAWYTRAVLQGDINVEYPAPFAIYGVALAAEMVDPNGPLLDNGTYPRLGLKAMADVGVVAMNRWNDVGRVTERLPWEILRESSDRRGVRFARVDGQAEMRRALASGFPLVVAFDVDQSFEDYRGGVWTGMRGRSLGGHCTTLIGYDVGKFRGVNSWAETWGEHGLYWISDLAALDIEAWAVELVSTPSPSPSVAA